MEPQHKTPKPPVLRQPRRLLRFAAILLGLLLLIYAATAATGFLKTENRAPDYRDSAPEAGQTSSDH